MSTGRAVTSRRSIWPVKGCWRLAADQGYSQQETSGHEGGEQGQAGEQCSSNARGRQIANQAPGRDRAGDGTPLH
jgi:hypothetical protein